MDLAGWRAARADVNLKKSQQSEESAEQLLNLCLLAG
jgi:hypothetical protein